MMKENVQDALNKQMNREFYSSYLYLSMSAYFESLALRGFAKWMAIQAKEEWEHGMKFYKHLGERGAAVKLAAIDAPPLKWDSPLKAFEETYKHEQKVTAWIGELVNLSVKEQDHATNNMLQWFVKEQVEEEVQTNTIVLQLRMIGSDGPALLMFDHGLGKRE
ncbi:MAG: ferritin [Methanomicrobiales archaeon]|nr:ferritin [Methanomicrobiales archaeon]